MHKYDAKYSDEYAAKLPELFETGMSIAQASRELGISRQTYYEWKDTHPEFKKAAQYGETLAEAFHEDILDSGSVGEIENFNVTAKIFTMKNRFRDSYGDKPLANTPLSAVENLLNLMHDNKSK